MAGDRQLVRLAVAQFFGGTQVTTDDEVKFQGGPLTAYGLGTAYPYSVRHAPDSDYTAGQPAGQNWGCVLSTTRVRRTVSLDSYGGPSSGIWLRKYVITCEIALLCELEHIEVAGAGLDDLIDQAVALIFADRTLGTNSGSGGVRILTAGTDKNSIVDETDRLAGVDEKKGRYAGDGDDHVPGADGGERMKYEYRGPVPVTDEAGELVHPLDVREFGEAPDCPPWRLLEEPEAEAPPPSPPPVTPVSPAQLAGIISAAQAAPRVPEGECDMAPPSTFSPVESREIWLARETVPDTLATALTFPWALTSFKDSNKPMWIEDESFQGAMGDVYGVYQGPEIASWDAGGHVFSDTIGLPLWGILGDYTATGAAGTGSTTLTAPVAAGATTATVTAITGFSSGQSVQLGITADGNPEIVVLSAAPSGTTLTFTGTPARFAHASAKTVAGVTAPYTHVFAVLNGLGGVPGGAPSQPPTLSAWHMDGLATNGGNAYAYSCISELAFTGNADKLLDFTCKATCAVRQAPATQLTPALVSAELATPSWRTTVGIGGVASGGTQVKNVGEHVVTITRAVKPQNTEQGSQAPYVIARGKQGVNGKISFTPAIDDTSLTALLANSQPQLQYLTSNGLSGASLRSLQLDILLAAYKTDDEQDGAELFGYEANWTGVHTAASSGGITMTGASGMKGAIKATLVNAVPTY